MAVNFREVDGICDLVTQEISKELKYLIKEKLKKQVDPILEEVATEMATTVKAYFVKQANTYFEPEFYLIFKDNERKTIK